MRRKQPQPTLNNWYISDKYTFTVRNKFDVLQDISETLNPNDEYENFVNAYIEAAAECIPTKLKARYSPQAKKKRAVVKTACLCHR